MTHQGTNAQRWVVAFEFAFWTALCHFCVFMVVARYGGPAFATEFDSTEVKCAVATVLLSFPIVLLAARFRCAGKS